MGSRRRSLSARRNDEFLRERNKSIPAHLTKGPPLICNRPSQRKVEHGTPLNTGAKGWNTKYHYNGQFEICKWTLWERLGVMLEVRKQLRELGSETSLS
ncbi:hypothetical protein AVEN_147898-1 [Araneus ventricosus]|uniref:Uncharacterized protein n=1 Tax=Araneus ventricosus TaxID=182803 RepID=A0A4Y2E0J1_ARAVE|nr:hypothetical protein AVEN_147898-1 [Araneus ventricosus]